MSPGVGEVGAVLDKMVQLEGTVNRLARMIGGTVAYGKGKDPAPAVLDLMLTEAQRQLDALAYASNLCAGQRDEITHLRALAAQADAGAVLEEAAQARHAHSLYVGQLDQLIGEREWDDAMQDPQVRAMVGRSDTDQRIQAAQGAVEQAIRTRAAALAQASAGGEG